MREFLFPLTWIYGATTRVRNWFYDHSLLKAVNVSVPVISIGNLTAGGTGKTPVTLALLELIKSKGYVAGVVSRGYRRQSKGVFEVDLEGASARRFGDEPVLIKTKMPDICVFVGERRVAAARQLLERAKVDFIVCDDAFQHRRLHRDLNILLFDVCEPERDYRMLPVGRAREALAPAVSRADFVILTKSNLVSGERLRELKDWITSIAPKPILDAEFSFSCFRSLNGETRDSLSDLVYMVSAVAKPESVDKTIDGRARVVKHKVFPDHHFYTNREVETFLDEAAALHARWIVCTAKDAAKLKNFRALQNRLWILEMRVDLKGELDPLYERIDLLARQRR